MYRNAKDEINGFWFPDETALEAMHTTLTAWSVNYTAQCWLAQLPALASALIDSSALFIYSHRVIAHYEMD